MSTEAIYVLAELEVPGVELGYLSVRKAARAIDKRLAKSGQLVWPFIGHRLYFTSGRDGGHIVIRTCLMPLADTDSFDVREQAHIQLAEMMAKLPFLANLITLNASENEALMDLAAWTTIPPKGESRGESRGDRPSLTVV